MVISIAMLNYQRVPGLVTPLKGLHCGCPAGPSLRACVGVCLYDCMPVCLSLTILSQYAVGALHRMDDSTLVSHLSSTLCMLWAA